MRRVLGSVFVEGSGSGAGLIKVCVDLPVQLVEIFTTNKTGRNEGRLNHPIQHAVHGEENMARERNSLDS